MSYIGNTPFTAAFLTDTFSGNGTTVAFTMSVAPANTSSILVAVTGVVQDPSTYSVSGTTLTFSAAPPSGTSNISVRYLGIPASGVTTTAYRTVTNFTATAGQTTFSTPSYTVGYIDVYRNGVRLGSADYTATSGTTVVLTSAASAGDSVVTESFYVSSVLNAIPATASSVSTTYLQDASVTQAKLGTNVAGNGPSFSAYLTTSGVNVPSSTFTKVPCNAEEWDTANAFDSVTNYRFQPSIAGYYQFSAGTSYNSATAASNNTIALFKNGTQYKYGSSFGSASANAYNTISVLVYMNGSTDYAELYVFQNSGSTQTLAAQQTNTWFQGFLARAA